MFKSRAKKVQSAVDAPAQDGASSGAGTESITGQQAIRAGEVADRALRAGPPSIDALLATPAVQPRRMAIDETPKPRGKIAEVPDAGTPADGTPGAGGQRAVAAGQAAPGRLAPSKPDGSGLMYFKKRDEMVAVQRGAFIATRHMKGDVRVYVATSRTMSAIGPLTPTTAVDITQPVVADLLTEIEAAEEAANRG